MHNQSMAGEKKLKKKTQELSIKEGDAAAVMSGAGESYVIPYAIALNANNVQIGFLASFVNLLGSMSQIFGEKLVYNFKRRGVIISSVLTQATMWVLILSLGVLVWKNVLNGYAAGILIILYSLYSIAGNFMVPAWFSLMGDIVKEDERGRYFSRRNKIVNIVAISVSLAAAVFLDYMKNIELMLLGFIILFLIASIGRYISAFYFSRHYFPKYNASKETGFGLVKFIKESPKNNFGHFVIYSGLISLVVNFAAPFFAVYMLNELDYSYLWMILVLISQSVFLAISMPFFGKLCDKYGNKQVLKIGSCLIPFASLLWVFSKDPIVLIFTAQLASGIGWAAFNLASSNFIYDAVKPKNRGMHVAYFNAIGGVGAFLGAMLGGLFAEYVNVGFANVFVLIFLISGIARAIVALIFVPRIKEARVVARKKKITLFDYLRVGAPRPFTGISRGIFSILMNMNRKAEYLGFRLTKFQKREKLK